MFIKTSEIGLRKSRDLFSPLNDRNAYNIEDVRVDVIAVFINKLSDMFEMSNKLLNESNTEYIALTDNLFIILKCKVK